MKRNNILFAVGLFFVIAAIAGALVFGAGSRVRRTPIDAQINPTKPMVALTFDDGPDGTWTPQVLDLLYEIDARATCFLLG